MLMGRLMAQALCVSSGSPHIEANETMLQAVARVEKYERLQSVCDGCTSAALLHTVFTRVG